MPEYETWKESLGGTTAGWNIKYYKAGVAAPYGAVVKCLASPPPSFYTHTLHAPCLQLKKNKKVSSSAAPPATVLLYVCDVLVCDLGAAALLTRTSSSKGGITFSRSSCTHHTQGPAKVRYTPVVLCCSMCVDECVNAVRELTCASHTQGLGTSTREEAREYFAAINQHCKKFVWTGVCGCV